MGGLLQLFTRRVDRSDRHSKVESLGSNPLFYKVLTVDKKVYKIKRRRWG